MTLYQNGQKITPTKHHQAKIESILVKEGMIQVSISKEDSKILLGSIKKDPAFKNLHRHPVNLSTGKCYEFNFVSPEKWKLHQA